MLTKEAVMSMPVQGEVVLDTGHTPSEVAKAIVAILTAVLTVVVAALNDGEVSDVELANIGIAFLTALGVYLVPNIKDQTAGRWAKAIVAVLGTALQALVPFLINGEVTNSNWLTVLLAGLGALAVGVVPNTPPATAVVLPATPEAPHV